MLVTLVLAAALLAQSVVIHSAPDGAPYVNNCPAELDDVECYQAVIHPYPNDDFICHVEEDRSFECGANDGSGQVDRSRPYVTGCAPTDDDDSCQPD